MNAERHFEKAEGFDRSQGKLDAADDAELIVEGCYFSAHHLIVAGTEWRGVPHSQSHPHGQNLALLKHASAPMDVLNAWSTLERLRSGSVYGGKTSGTTSGDARRALAAIRGWTTAGKPQSP